MDAAAGGRREGGGAARARGRGAGLQQVGLSGDLGDLAPVGAAVLAANVAAAGVVVFRGSERPAFAALRALVGGPLVLLEEGSK